MSKDDFSIRPIMNSDCAWVADFITRQWGAGIVVAHGVIYRPSELPGFVATIGGKLVGLITYQVESNSCEIVTLNSIQSNRGVGSALINTVVEHARQLKCERLWLITTNDNLNALRFYQKRGMVLVAVHRNAAEQARKLKPQIPLIGEHGIPLRDEIELEMIL